MSLLLTVRKAIMNQCVYIRGGHEILTRNKETLFATLASLCTFKENTPPKCMTGDVRAEQR